MAGAVDHAIAREEVRPGFTWPYLLLTLLISLLTGGVGFLSNYLFAKTTAQKKVIKVAITSGDNFLAIAKTLNGKISYKFYIPNDNRPINSYFQYTVSLLNDSETSIKDFDVLLEVDDRLSLIKPPEIVTDPVGIRDSKSFTNNQIDRQEKNIAEWKTSFLNSGNRVQYTFVAYSVDSVDPVRPRVNLLKEDWTQQDVSSIVAEVQSPKENLLSKRLSDFTGRDLILFTIFLGTLIGGLVAYFQVFWRFYQRRRVL